MLVILIQHLQIQSCSNQVTAQQISLGDLSTWQLVEINDVSISYSNIEDGLDSIVVIDDSNIIPCMFYKMNPVSLMQIQMIFVCLASSQMINAGHPDSLDSDGTRADMGVYPYLNDYNGTYWYISEDGDDVTGTGSEDDPFRSIQAALNFGSDGDTALVSSGTYNENLVYRYDEAESVRSVSIVGESRNETIIDANNNGHGIFFPMNGYSSPTISNITIQNGFGDNGGGVHVAQNYYPIFYKQYFDKLVQYRW